MHAAREQPDGVDDFTDPGEDELDPRVEIELDKLNSASDSINILEKELDEARAIFRLRLTDAARELKQLAKTLGNNIDKARPYFEALSQAKKAQQECANAAMTFERACDAHKGARHTISVAEEKLMHNPSMFDPAWQEMLNNANLKILEAEKEKLKNEGFHHEATLAYIELEQRKTLLEKQLKKSINKARPYFDQKSRYLGYLENQKERITELETAYANAKQQYARSLRELEFISEDIHRKRNQASSFPTKERQECIGAECPTESPTSKPSRVPRRVSEQQLVNFLEARRSKAKGRFRSSLLLDLDVDFDLDESFEDISLKSPSSKSVDIGCVNMRYYDEYQLLDIAPFLEKDKQNNLNKQFSHSAIHGHTETEDSELPKNGNRSRKNVVINKDFPSTSPLRRVGNESPKASPLRRVSDDFPKLNPLRRVSNNSSNPLRRVSDDTTIPLRRVSEYDIISTPPLRRHQRSLNYDVIEEGEDESSLIKAIKDIDAEDFRNVCNANAEKNVKSYAGSFVEIEECNNDKGKSDSSKNFISNKICEGISNGDCERNQLNSSNKFNVTPEINERNTLKKQDGCDKNLSSGLEKHDSKSERSTGSFIEIECNVSGQVETDPSEKHNIYKLAESETIESVNKSCILKECDDIIPEKSLPHPATKCNNDEM